MLTHDQEEIAKSLSAFFITCFSYFVLIFLIMEINFYFNGVCFTEDRLVVNLDITLGDPFQATLANDPETREIVPMGKLGNDTENNLTETIEWLVCVCVLSLPPTPLSPFTSSLPLSPLPLSALKSIPINSLCENN